VIAPDVTIQLSEVPLPASLHNDAAGAVLCQLDAPPGTSFGGGLTLSIATDAMAPASATLFRWDPPKATLQPTLSANSHAVDGLVSATGQYGVTISPGDWSLSATFGTDVSVAGDRSSLFRNISGQPIRSAFYDGTRLYLGSGTRLLIYKGIPGPDTKPAVVLGQPDLDTNTGVSSASSFGGGVNGMWTDGTQLFVSAGHRVLVWHSIPTVNFTPADLVLGQADFASDSPNAGGIGAATMNLPAQISSDGKRLLVADMLNSRVLVWNSMPVAIGQPADAIIGQPSAISSGIGVGATQLYQAAGAQLDSSGAFVSSMFSYGVAHVATVSDNAAADFHSPANSAPVVQRGSIAQAAAVVHVGTELAVRDSFGNRIAVYGKTPQGATPIDFVIGQPDPDRAVVAPVNASSLSTDGYVGSLDLGGGSLLLVPDGLARLLIFETPPTYNYEPASRVLGQPGFTTDQPAVDYRFISGSTLAGPSDVAIAGGTIAVADRNNNRVTLYAASDVVPGKQAVATVVLGQPDAKSYVPNFDQVSPAADRLSGPGGVALDGTHLIVADTENHRVLIWLKVPVATGAPADIVLGQGDFSGRRPNHGRGDINPVDHFSDADADGFFGPTGVTSDGTHLFVADRLNHRVLGWSTFPVKNGQAADIVIGQPDATSLIANRGLGGYAAAADGLNLPTGLLLDGTSLWVADTENNRVVRWDHVTSAPVATAFIGQPDGQTLANPNYGPIGSPNAGYPRLMPTTATSVLRPRGVAKVGSLLAVSESDSNRVHLFDAGSLKPVGELGQTKDTDAFINSGGLGAGSLSAPLGIGTDGKRLLVADAGNHRVTSFDATQPLATGTAATAVLGQPNPLSSGFNQAGGVDGATLQRPSGLALADGHLFIADTLHNRVLVVAAPPKAGDIAIATLGQGDATSALANRGGAPAANTLSGPRALFTDSTRVIVADTGNHRVLLYDGFGSPDAKVVLGQADFASNQRNRGGAVSASTMNGPQGVFFDGTRLFVADTANHRVLGWNALPAANGQPADFVLGQTDLAGQLPNRGAELPSAGTLSFPSGIRVVGGSLLIADSGNNRILRFSTVPSATGAVADGVLGQSDFTSRFPASDPLDGSRLSGPDAVADDGTDLYICDRDLGRVLIYPLGATTGATAQQILGGTSLPLSVPSAVVAEPTPFFTSRLYIADTGADRVEVIGSVSRLVQ
jgi:hypothetical protein